MTVAGAHVERGTPTDDLVETVTLTPRGGTVIGFDLHYDVILAQLVRAVVTVRAQFNTGTTSRTPHTLGVLDWTRNTIHVDAAGGSWLRGFIASVRLGVQHIGEGADHLLFLLMLLLPAPLVACAGRWRRGGDGRRSVIRVVMS